MQRCGFLTGEVRQSTARDYDKGHRWTAASQLGNSWFDSLREQVWDSRDVWRLPKDRTYLEVKPWKYFEVVGHGDILEFAVSIHRSMEDQIERGLKGFQDSRSSSKWSKSFLWKWSWLKQRSAFLSISGQFNFIPSASICHVSRYFLASDLMNLMMSHPRRHDIDAKQRLENEFVHVSLLQRSWGRECKWHICYGWMVELTRKTHKILVTMYIYIYTYMSKQDFLFIAMLEFPLPFAINPCHVGGFLPWLLRVVEPWHAQWCSKRGLGGEAMRIWHSHSKVLRLAVRVFQVFVVACLWVNGPCRWMEIWQKNM